MLFRSQARTIQLGTVLAFRIAVSHGIGAFGVALGYPGIGNGYPVYSTANHIREFTYGSLVTGTLNAGAKQLATPPWAAGVPGFEGFSVRRGGGGWGWAELEIGVDGDGFPDSVTLLGMAYEIGTNINAGELPPPVPEPGTAGLMLLALGAAGVAVLRKRKQVRE